MYKTKGILLHQYKIRDNSIRYIFFTKEYGKISCFSKKNTQKCGSGDIIHLVIERKGTTNILHDTEIKESLESIAINYKKTHAILHLLRLLYEVIPEGEVYESIYEDYIKVMQHEKKIIDPSIQNILLMQIRILKKLGYINKEDLGTFGDISRYIYQVIDQKDMKTICEGKCLEADLLTHLEHIIYKTTAYSLS